MDESGRNKRVSKHVKNISSLCLLFVAIACLLQIGSADRSGNGDHPILTDEMIELIKSVKAGGYTNDHKKPALKKKRRSSKVKSSSQSPNSSRKKSTSQDTISTEVTVIIPGFGKASGRRESGVDVWKG